VAAILFELAQLFQQFHGYGWLCDPTGKPTGVYQHNR
jgi:hypothetical protein